MKRGFLCLVALCFLIGVVNISQSENLNPRFVKQWKVPEKPTGLLSHFITIDGDGNVYVSVGSVEKFSSWRSYIATISGDEKEPITVGLATDREGNLYVNGFCPPN